MKKVTILSLLLLLMCLLTACGSGANVRTEEEAERSNSETAADAPISTGQTELAEKENTLEDSQDAIELSGEENFQETAETSEGSNILIVYFSRYGNTEYPDDVDATTSASILADAQTDHPDLSVDVIPIGRITSDLSVFDDLGSREDVTFSIAQ